MLRRLIGEHITLTTELRPDVPTIRADRTQVQQVLLNQCLSKPFTPAQLRSRVQALVARSV